MTTMEQTGPVHPYRFLEQGGEMGKLIQAHDWTASAVGPIGQWPPALRIALGLLLPSRLPALLFWGPALTLFYNDAFRPLLNGRHPAALGRTAREVWPETWHTLEPLLMKLMTCDTTPSDISNLLPVFYNQEPQDNSGRLTYTPVYDENDQVSGISITLQEVSETTEQRLRLEENQKRFASLMRQAPAGIAIFQGTDFVVEMANDYYLTLTGKGPELIGKPMWEAMPEVAAQGFEKIINEVLRTGVPYRATGQKVEIMRDQLDTLYVDFVYEPLKDLDGTINRIMVVATDVSTQVISRRQIGDAEERARLAVEATQLGTFDYDIGSSAIITSPRFDTIFGLDVALSHRNYVERIHPDDAHIRETAHQEALTTGHLFYEVRVVWPDSSEHWVRVKGKIYHNEEGLPRRLLGTALDITEERGAREALARTAESLEREVEERTRELAESNQQLMRINSELEQFAYVASHDLQEPLRKVRTFTQMLESHLDAADDRSKGLLAKISASSARMLALIRDVLNLSQLSSSEKKYLPVDLNELLAHVLEDFELLIEQKGAVITCAGLPVIEGLPMQLNQLFTNLISNSLKFSVSGKTPEIHITMTQMDPSEVAANPELNPGLDYFCLRFADNGIGFGQEHAQQIFTIFQRLHDRHSYSGTGIGLALCKKIAANHQGDIYARSIPGEGATFYVLLPLTQEEVPPQISRR